MSSLFRSSVVAALVGIATLSGCSDRDPGAGGDGQIGTVSLEVQLAPGLHLNALNYTITGPNAFHRMGTLNLSSSTVISGLLGGIPAGNGYNITVTGVASDGVTTCGGAAVFNVSPGAVTIAVLHLICREPARTGSVKIQGTINICPTIDSLSATPAEVAVGSTIALSAAAHDTDGVPSPIAYAWTVTSGSVTNPTAANATFNCTGPGDVTVTLAVTDGDCSSNLTATVTCTGAAPDAGVTPDAAAPAPVVRFNEVESNGGTPGDWAELINVGTGPADIGGWVFKDNDDTHAYAIPAGTVIPPGGFYVLEEAAFGFGLGANESVRLYTSATGPLVDSHAWPAHATTTYRRCPDGTGPFGTAVTVTKGAANDCGGGTPDAGTPDTTPPPADTAPPPADGAIAIESWPGQNMVVTGDNLNQFGDNLSGLVYEPAAGGSPAVLWAALNGPGSIFRLIFNGTIWTFDTAGDWGAGKTLKYPGGTGNPDTESLTRAEFTAPFVYTATERNNDASSVSKLAILRFDSSAAGTVLTATHEWNLTATLPVVGANLGLEAITWVPDTHLVAQGFLDESRGNVVYDPAFYPNHGTGLFVVGVEGTGLLYAYALDHGAGGVFTRIATIASGHPGVMGLEFDRDNGALWASCDNTCAGQQNVLGVVGGKFQVRRAFARPSTLPDSNNEGIAISNECVGGFKKFFWSDDSHFAGHALRIDSIPCAPLF
jgi:hypothetical protein